MGTELERHSIHAHIQNNDIKTEDGTPLDWKDHMFMFDIYSDMASLEKDIVGFKAAQVTFTTTASIAVLWIAKNKEIDIIYTLPTFDDIRQFSGGKVNRIIAQNPVYQEWVKDKDTIEQKIVGNNIIYYRPSFQQKAAMMVSSDLNVYDEIDASNQAVIEQYSTRLQHSNLKRQWYFSHPSVPGNGVDRYWHKSDQKHWFVKCGECKKWQYLRWPQSVDMDRGIYQCIHCQSEITDEMRRRGKWVRKYKNRPLSGYWIPLLICPWVPAKEIIGYYYDKSPEYFYNKVLGLPYVGGGNKVMQKQIYQNCTPDIHKQEARIVIGLDTGLKLTFVVGNREQGLFFYGECDDYDEIRRMLKRWPRSILVADQGGDIIGIRKLREEFPGRVFLAYYQGTDKKALQLVKWGKRDEDGVVHVDRNRMIQLVIDEFTDSRLPLHYVESVDDWYDYWIDWSNIYRIAEEDKRTKKNVYRWERSDRDHYVHATVYWRVGVSRFGGKGAVYKPNGAADAEPNSYFITPGEKTEVNPLAKPIEKAIEHAAYEAEDDYDWRL